MPVGAAVGAIGTIGGAVSSISAANSASKTAKNTAAANNALQTQIYNQNKATLAPYVATGNSAGSAISALLGLSGDTGQSQAFQNYLNSTGYQFQVQQGQKSVEAALGAKGLLDSGAALKSLNNYGQQAALTGFNTYLSQLEGQQGVGLTAASAQAGVGTNYANAVSANNTNAANARANADLANGRTIANALGSLTSLGTSYFGGGL